MSNTTGIEKHTLKSLRKAIPYGGLNKIHEMHTELMKAKGEDALSYETISAVLRGLMYRQDVIDVAIEYVAAENERQKSKSTGNSQKLKAALS